MRSTECPTCHCDCYQCVETCCGCDRPKESLVEMMNRVIGIDYGVGPSWAAFKCCCGVSVVSTDGEENWNLHLKEHMKWQA